MQHAPYALHASLVSRIEAELGDDGVHQFDLRCMNDDGAEVMPKMQGQFTAPHGGGANNLILNFQTAFPSTGRYTFVLRVDNVQLDTCTIQVAQAPPQPHGPGNAGSATTRLCIREPGARRIGAGRAIPSRRAGRRAATARPPHASADPAWVTTAGRALPLILFGALAWVSFRHHPLGDYFTESDFFEYAAGGAAIRAGHVAPGRYGVIGPVYEMLLAAAGAVVPDLFRFASLLSAAATALTTWLWIGMTRRRLGPRVAFWTGALIAVNPVTFRYGYSATTDAVATALQAAALFALFAGGGPLRIAAAGAVAALATLTRYTGIYLVPAALAVLFLSPDRARRVRLAAAYLAGFAIVFGPWLAFSVAHGHLPGENLFRNYGFYETESAARNVQDTTAVVTGPSSHGLGMAPLRALGRLPDHLAKDAHQVLGWPIALLCAAGLALAIVRRTWRTLLPFWIAGGCLFVILGAAFYSDRYSLPLVPVYLMLAAVAIAGAARRGPRSAIAAGLLGLAALAYSGANAYRLERFTEGQLPAEVLPAARSLAAHSGPADAVLARKAAVAWYARRRFVAFPRLSTLPQLAEYAARNGARFLYFSWYEGELRPEFWYLLDTTAAVPGLERLNVTHANPSILYRITPGFGAAPAWMADDTLRRIHDLRGYVQVVADPDAYDMHRSLGIHSRRLGETAAAADHFRAMAALRPGEVEPWVLLGESELDRRRYAAAHEAFVTASRVAPFEARARVGLGLSEFALGRVDAAATTLEPVLRRVTDRRVLAALGTEYERRGDGAGLAQARAQLAATPPGAPGIPQRPMTVSATSSSSASSVNSGHSSRP